jgi:hypothetical protein
MARVDFRVPTEGVKVGKRLRLDSQGSDQGAVSGDFFNQGGVPKWHNGTATKTLAYTDSNITGTSAAWTTARTVTFATGDVTGSFSIDGSGDVSNVALTIAANSVALGTDTTGNYVATVAGTTDQITVSGSGSETAAITLSLPQNIATTSSPSFAGLTLSGDAAVNGGDLTTTAGTFNLVNTNATTLNIGGAATAVGIGAGTGNTTVNNNLVVTGNLTVNGSTTTVNSTVTTVDDPIITLGGDTAPGSDDGKDRGIEFRWYDTQARVGFFGFDDSTGKFTFIPQATNSSEVFSGTKGTVDVGSVETSTLFVDSIEIDTTSATTSQVLQFNGTKFAPATLSSASAFTTISVSGQTDVVADQSSDTLTLANGTGITITTNATTDTVTVTNSGVTSLAGTTNEIEVSGATGAVTLSLPTTINANTTGTAASWTNSRTVSFSGGDVTGSFSIDGSANVSNVALTIAANSVALGTDTTGDYVASLTQGTGVTITGGSGEGSTPTIAIGQAVGTTDSPTFAAVNISDGSSNNVNEDFDSSTLTTVTPTSVKSISSTTYRSVKYVVQAVQGTNYMITEILAVHDGSNVSYTEYGTVVIGTAPASFDVDINTGNIRLMATSASTSSTVYRVRTTGIPA